MKTYLITIVLILGLSVASLGKPINEIYSVKEPTIAEEAYVNDIPFNTRLIASDALLDGYEAKLEEEANVEDIPFDTWKIACKYQFCKLMLSFREAEADDIPFDTEAIYQECLMARMTGLYREEKNCQDTWFEKNEPAHIWVVVRSPKKIQGKTLKIRYDDELITYPVTIEIPNLDQHFDYIMKEISVSPIFSL
jgi:hypothetical protein